MHRIFVKNEKNFGRGYDGKIAIVRRKIKRAILRKTQKNLDSWSKSHALLGAVVANWVPYLKPPESIQVWESEVYAELPKPFNYDKCPVCQKQLWSNAVYRLDMNSKKQYEIIHSGASLIIYGKRDLGMYNGNFLFLGFPWRYFSDMLACGECWQGFSVGKHKGELVNDPLPSFEYRPTQCPSCEKQCESRNLPIAHLNPTHPDDYRVYLAKTILEISGTRALETNSDRLFLGLRWQHRGGTNETLACGACWTKIIRYESKWKRICLRY